MSSRDSLSQGRLDGALHGILRLARLNIFWLAVTVIGAGVLGAWPATWALGQSLRSVDEGGHPPSFAAFTRFARREALRANALGYAVMTLPVVVWFYLRLVPGLNRPVLVGAVAAAVGVAVTVLLAMAVQPPQRRIALALNGAAQLLGRRWAAPVVCLVGVGLPVLLWLTAPAALLVLVPSVPLWATCRFAR